MGKYKIVILGSDGMAGHLIKDYLSENTEFELFGITEKTFFGLNQEYINEINKFNPDLIINTLRITINLSQNKPQLAIYVNSVVPKVLEKYYYSKNVKIIHLSTDCIFSGIKGNYLENDLPDGESIYSLTKFCGEMINSKDITIRSSYIGPCLINQNEELFDWFMNQIGEIDGYSNSIWNGITTLELAKSIKKLILNDCSGIYHLCSGEKISKYNLLKLIKHQWKKKIHIKKTNNQKVDRSIVDSRRTLSIPDYKTMLNELYHYMKQRENIYDHYF